MRSYSDIVTIYQITKITNSRIKISIIIKKATFCLQKNYKLFCLRILKGRSEYTRRYMIVSVSGFDDELKNLA